MWGQQQWGQQQQAAPQQAAGGNSKDVTLVVTGCTHGTVGGIVRGSYQLFGENHGKPTYKKDGQVNGLDVMSYYWDERDGPGFCGWWFGPKVGGDQVWAYHTDKMAGMPPQNGWKVPYDGPVDPTFVISYKPKGGAGAQQQQYQQQQQQQYQQYQQQQPAQQQWGQQQQGGWQQQQQSQQMQQQQWAAKTQEQQRLDGQRSQLEELKRKQQLENANRAEALRKQQADQQQQKLNENRAKLAQANEARIAEQKRKMEEMKAQQAKLIEARNAEAKRKQEEEQKKKYEQVAVLNIRRSMQKFRACIPDKFDEAKKELDEAVAKDAEACGSQKEKLLAEIEQAVKATNERIEKVLEMKKKEEEKKEAENKRRRELKEKATLLVAELEKMVEKAEKSAKGVVEEADPFTSDQEMKLSEIESAATAVEEAGQEANELLKGCTDFIAKEGANMKNTPPVIGEPAATCAADLGKLVVRVNEAKKSTQTTLSKFTASKTSRIRKAQAKDKYEKGFTPFKKYDADKDGKLSRREIQAYSKGEFKFSIPTDALDNICDRLVKKDAKGVEKADFHKLRVMIGVSREDSLDKERKAKKEAREKMIANLKEKLTADVAKTAELIKEAGEAVAKSESVVKPLAGAKPTATAASMIAEADEADKTVEASKASVTAAKDAIAALSKETEPELKSFMAGEVKKLQNSVNPLDPRNTKVSAVAAQYRAMAAKKNSTELEALRVQGLAMIFYHQGAKKLLQLGLYEAFDKKKTGKIQESAFVKFFSSCEVKDDDDRMSQEDAARLFQYFDSDDTGFISKEVFLNLTRRFMKVLKASVMTDDKSMKSKPVRRLDEGEVLECFSGPTEVEGEEVTRIKVKAMKDNVEGWVTPVGNRGTIFMEEGGNLFKVAKETILTGSFVIGEDKGFKDRKLKVGEILEVKEWARKEENSGLERMKVRVKSDGQIGWVTSMGNTGIKFVEAV